MKVIEGERHQIIVEPADEFRQGSIFEEYSSDIDPTELPKAFNLPVGQRLDDWHNGKLLLGIYPRLGAGEVYTATIRIDDNPIIAKQPYDSHFSNWRRTQYQAWDPPVGFLVGFPVLQKGIVRIPTIHIAANWDVFDDSSWAIPLQDIAQIYQYDPEFALALADKQTSDEIWMGEGRPPADWDVVSQKFGGLVVPKLIYNYGPSFLDEPDQFYI